MTSDKIIKRFGQAGKEMIDSWIIVEHEIKKYFKVIDKRFPNFTSHDEKHSIALETILNWLVNNESWNELNNFDI